MQNTEASFTGMYEGVMLVHNNTNMPPITAYDSVYYDDNIGFEIKRTHKLAQDKPTISVIIPCDIITGQNEGEMPLKRLKHYLLNMEPNTTTYKEMYEGKVLVNFPPKSNGEILEPEFENNNIYWSENNSYVIELTHKLAQDKPTITTQIPLDDLSMDIYTTTAADHCLREFKPYIDTLNAEIYNRSRPDKENGKYYLHNPGGEVLMRNTAYFKLCPQKDYRNGSGNTVYILDDGVSRPPKMYLCIKIQVQLPQKKLRKTIQMLCKDLPDAVNSFVRNFNITKLNEALTLSEKQAAIRSWLKQSEYCCFIANGSILPRSKGSELPMENAIPFKSTPEDEIEVCGIKGMGIKRGVTVITGGGYSGKSTLLNAISAGIYNHIAGDGRKLVITDETAVSISAEDGRSVKNVNISPFIKWIPGGDTFDFSTEHASGSTSQAANIMEAINFGSKLFLIDEDRSATNFMIRDRMMKQLIEHEPITPYTDRVNELYKNNEVSTVLVIGGSGEYLSVADRIYMMDEFEISDVTGNAKKICDNAGIITSYPEPVEWHMNRILLSDSFTSYPEGNGTERLEVSDMGFILIGDERIDIRNLHHIKSTAQLTALGFILRKLEVTNNENIIDLEKLIDFLYDEIEREGLDCVFSSFFTTCERFLDLPRKYELLAVISRMRKIAFIRL